MIADRLAELGLTLPAAHPPHEPIDAVVVHDGIAYVSGQLPRRDGVLTAIGLAGEDVDEATAHAAAADCALNALAALDRATGLDSVARILTVTGYVACVPAYDRVAQVVDGASKLLVDVLGDAGRHTRTAIGVAALPRNATVELSVTAAIR